MADEVRRFTVTTPAGTSQSTPQVTSLSIPDRIVDVIRLRIPPGPSGQLGVALYVGGGQVIPYEAGVYFVGNDEREEYPLDNFPTTGSWQTYTYNTGAYAHSVYLTFLLSPLTQVQAPPLQPITSAQLATVG